MGLNVQVLITLASHWRRKPLQAAALVTGLAVATALWSGVQALNAQARSAYAEAAAVLGGDRLDSIVPASGLSTGGIAVSDYVALRRAGWRVSPVIDGRWRGEGLALRLLGIDPLTLPPDALPVAPFEDADELGGFLRPPFRLLASPETVAEITAAGAALDAEAIDGLPVGLALGDIALVDELLGRGGRIDRLIVGATQVPGRAGIEDLTDGRLGLRPPDPEGAELARLTDSFHLNLTAFGLLSFVVGLFIVHATIGLSFEQRRPMIRTLRAIGVPLNSIAVAMLLELGVLALAAGALGMLLGYAMAAALLPDVAASLGGLYGADVPGELRLAPGWWAAGFGMALAGTLISALGSLWKLRRLPVLSMAQSEAWRGAQARSLKLQLALAAGLALAATGLASAGSGLFAGFALMGAVLLAAALALPSCLAAVIEIARTRAQGPIAGWFWAEARAQIGGLSLALMALLLALAVNIGVGTMVQSFRGTFLDYLDQRLAADLYLRGTDEAQAARMADFLRGRADVIAILPVQETEVRLGGYPVFVYGLVNDPMYADSWPLLKAGPAPWARLHAGEAVIVSEQMARARDLELGDRVDLGGQGAPWAPEVVGVYPDYGNPTGQALIAHARLTARWPGTPLTRFGVRVEDGASAAVLAALADAFELGPEQAVDQARLKAISREVFERTFAVTLALNALTFAVAGLALLTSLLTLSEMRLAQVAPLWALGLTRARLARLEVLRAVALAAVTAVLAIPLGLIVAWILLAVINVDAFGWRIPQAHFPGDWARLGIMALAVAALAALIPARRLARTPPALLVRIFSDER